MSPSPHLVAELFDAAVDDARWAGVASLIAVAVGIERVAIIVNRHTALPDISITPNILEFIGRYDQHYIDLDPWARRRQLLKPRGVILANELYSEQTLLRSEFYNDYARHVGMLRPMTIDLLSPAGHQVEVGCDQPFGSLGHEDKPALEALTPFIARAVDVRQSFIAAHARQRVHSTIMDAWAVPTVICDRDGRILSVNGGVEELARGGFLSLKSNTLVMPLASPPLRMQARRMIANACDGGPGGSFHIRTDNPDGLLLVTISPVPASLDQSPAYCMVTFSASHIRHFSTATLREMFDLSAAQAELAMALYDGLTLETYAVKRAVKISTVRTQLLQLFDKLGVNNQKDVVGILGRIPPVKT